MTVPLAALLAACSNAANAPSGGVVVHSNAEVAVPQNAGTGGGASAGVASGPGAPAIVAPLNGPAQDLSVQNGSNAKTATPSLGIPQGRIERSVTVDFEVPHDGFLDAFDKLIVRAADLGGYVLSSSTSPGSGGRIDQGSLIVRVPSAKLNDMVTGVPSSWQVSSIDYGSVDHTAETIDLSARLKAITAHRNALQKLLDSTTNLNDITTLENQLADVQQQLDQVQGQLDSVNGRVDMATATIGLREKGVVAHPAPKPQPPPRVLQAIADGWNNAVAVISGVTVGLFSALPLLVIAALVLLGWRRTRRPLPTP